MPLTQESQKTVGPNLRPLARIVGVLQFLPFQSHVPHSKAWRWVPPCPGLHSCEGFWMLLVRKVRRLCLSGLRSTFRTRIHTDLEVGPSRVLSLTTRWPFILCH